METTTSPYATPTSNVEQAQSAEPPRYFKGWLIFLVAGTIGGAILGGAAGAVAGFVLQSQGLSMQAIQIAGGVAGFIANLPLSYFLFKWSVSKYVIRDQTA